MERSLVAVVGIARTRRDDFVARSASALAVSSACHLRTRSGVIWPSLVLPRTGAMSRRKKASLPARLAGVIGSAFTSRRWRTPPRTRRRDALRRASRTISPASSSAPTRASRDAASFGDRKVSERSSAVDPVANVLADGADRVGPRAEVRHAVRPTAYGA